MFGWITDGISDEFSHIRGGLGSFSEDVLSGIGAVLSLLTFLAAMACCIWSIGAFASDGGYSDILGELMSIRGNAGNYYQMPVFAILGGCNIALLLVSYLLFFKKEKTGFRILGAVPFVVVIACYAIYSVMLLLYNQGKIASDDTTRTLAYGLLIAGMVAAVISVVLLLMREKEMSRSCLRMLILCFALLPLLTFLLENLIFLVIAIIAIVVLKIFVFKGSSDSDYSKPEKPDKAPTGTETEAPKPTGLTKEQQAAIYRINKRYKEGSMAIVKANNEVGAAMFSDKTKRELAALRKELEKEAEREGVKGKVSIY